MKARKTLNGADLYRAGVSYYNDGNVVNREGKRVGFAFLCDSVTQAQKDALKAVCPSVEFRTSSPEYAPEMKRVAIFIPR